VSLEGHLTNPEILCVGICVNTSALEEDEANNYLRFLSEEYSLPAVDPIRTGAGAVVEELKKQFA